jgi:hypothetical protein
MGVGSTGSGFGLAGPIPHLELVGLFAEPDHVEDVA